ncbi:MAG: RHS repeat-associated core domain-containing protein [Ruminococcus callidus]|uniref:RHS repeat-associated core domain-containing protein n=1 Tax=Ruminococcus callidus TaxID=40519 RepID=UPI002E792928|nr:RHS repeat-associated core domain-containing protein [Ruminococcus callidus]MEE0505975.1 RHS repeat-associated core domain-containing protein [Ruminococcus callidus]
MNLTDSTGTVAKSYKYDAFGVEQNIDDADSNVFRYCGEYYDSESGTIYLRAWYYDPTIGRFISRDSYTGKNEDPLSLNLYTYCGNNSLLYFDPSGHSFALPMEAVYVTVGLLAVTTLSIVAINANNSQIQSSCRSLSNTIAKETLIKSSH